MNRRPSIRWIRVGIVVGAAMIFAAAGSAQTQEVQSRVMTHQAAIAKPAEDPLAGWETEYAKALETARQLQSSTRTRELGEQLELDLQAYDEALKVYVRASERLRHKDRALTATAASLDLSNQMQSRAFQVLSNALKAAHDVENASIRNVK